MREVHLPFPELGLIAATRAALGAGIGLLIADYFTHDQRRNLGGMLVAIGVLSTIPLAADVLGRRIGTCRSLRSPSAGSGKPSLASFVP
jgi:hypothetical protein